MNIKRTLFTGLGSMLLALLFCHEVEAKNLDQTFSTAGFYALPQTGREVQSMNLAWRFIKKDVPGNPYEKDFDDSDWSLVSLPHGLEDLPSEASGGANYQGIAWYRKHFDAPQELKGKKVILHFEGIMGKSEVYLNNTLIKTFHGGYSPVIVDITDHLDWNASNVIAVKADNSNNPDYPIGKPQTGLDFTYCGGIYRDCWLISHHDIYITNANAENEVAGGGVFVSYADVSDQQASIHIKTHLRNSSTADSNLTVLYELKDRENKLLVSSTTPLSLACGEDGYSKTSFNLPSPHLWSPKDPYLHYLDIYLKNADGKIVDGYRQKIGIRSIEFKKDEGLWINGKPYGTKIMGTNRHQEFAVVGNAMPNSLQWRDAKKLRDAGMEVVRTHYIIDPAFMDSCDELGLFALVETPGWQFWNKSNPKFEERVYRDIRNMIRQNRNHASLFFWEPILNETSYPDSFAKNARKICDEEYPYPYSIAACDDAASGDQYFDLLLRPRSVLRPNKTYFIREWGDNVDDWNAQNSDSRVAREWGENPMLIQAEHYANPPYKSARLGDDGKNRSYSILCYDSIMRSDSRIVGASFWHSFDHQRGYHCDPFYGGFMTAYRQPKYSYYMFTSQRPATINPNIEADSGPMVYIAHELTPFSPRDVTVYSNCDEVRLSMFNGELSYSYKRPEYDGGIPSPIISFKNVFHFMDWKYMARAGRQADSFMLAEGIIDGKVVATHKRYNVGQAYSIRLRLDDENTGLNADGSDVVALVAEVVDKRGHVKRLNNSTIRFSVEGEGRMIGVDNIAINPTKVLWGSAVAMIQSSAKVGKIKVVASMLNGGSNRPLEGVLEFESRPNPRKELYDVKELEEMSTQHMQSIDTESKGSNSELRRENLRLQKEINQLKVKEVEQQQTYFGKGIND